MNRELLKNRNYFLFWLGQSISDFGDQIFYPALAIWVGALTGSPAAMSYVFIAEMLPAFLLGPIAGALVDRWNLRRTMLLMDLFRFIFLLPLLLISSQKQFWLIVLVTFLVSNATRFFNPARATCVRFVVADEMLTAASSMRQISFYMALLLGPALASLLMSVAKPQLVMGLNALSFLISAGFIWLIKIQGDRQQVEPFVAQQLLGDLKEGFRFAITNQVFRAILIGIALMMFLVGANNVLGYFFIERCLHTNPSYLGYLNLPLAIGMLLAALGWSRVKDGAYRAEQLLPLAILLMGLFLLGYSLSTQLWVAMFFDFLIGICNGSLNIMLSPLFMKVTPKELLGRMSSIFEMMIMGTQLVAIYIAGKLGELLSLRLIFGGAACLMFLGGVYLMLVLPKAYQNEVLSQVQHQAIVS